MTNTMKHSASREQNNACISSAEAQPMFEQKLKHSGIPWIGDIPNHWEVELIGNHIKEVDCPNSANNESNALQFKMGTIIPKKGGDSKYNPETLESYNIVEKGDIIINGLNLSFDFISQRVGLVKEKGVITSAYLAVRPDKAINSEYLTYLFKAYDNCKAFHGMGKGLRQTLAYKEFKTNLIFVPPLTEQKAIADYLDKHCAEVDEMVSLQEKIIEELRAYRQAIITETVTRGLNPNAPMKDSGVEWIGQIPEGWEMERIKNDSVFINGYAFNSDSFTINDGVKVIRIGDIGSSIDYDNCAKSTEINDSLAAYLIRENDILIAMSGATTGKSCLAKNIQEAYINQRVGIIRSKLYHFISYVLQASYIFEYINLNNAGSAQPNISGQAIGNIPIPIPSLAEQQAIAAFLDKKCSEIDKLIAIKQKKVDELKEYKKSLIYEYVTGKKQPIL